MCAMRTFFGGGGGVGVSVFFVVLTVEGVSVHRCLRFLARESDNLGLVGLRCVGSKYSDISSVSVSGGGGGGMCGGVVHDAILAIFFNACLFVTFVFFVFLVPFSVVVVVLVVSVEEEEEKVAEEEEGITLITLLLLSVTELTATQHIS